MPGRPSRGPRKQVNVRLPEPLIERIDTARGVISRDLWMERAAEHALRPAAAVVNPELRQQEHTHTPHQPLRTEFKNGLRERIFRCKCGAEVKG